MTTGRQATPAPTSVRRRLGRSAPLSRTGWTCVRLAGGGAILAVLVWRLGTGPFLDAIQKVDWKPLAAAVAITALTTVCAAWRWCLVADGLGVGLPLRAAVAAYYRSQFLNATLPGGVVGDVHRGVRHGQAVGDLGRGLRAVAWERFAGQFVQFWLTIVVLLVLPSPMHSFMPVVATAVAAVLGAAFLAQVLPLDGASLAARTVRGASADLRDGLLARRTLPGIALCSVLVVAGHAAIFVIAARTAGSAASPLRILPLGLVVLLAMMVPTSIAGWGPREGVAAWVFASSGMSAAQGVATAVVYGLMALVATAPGAAVLVVAWLRRASSDPHGAAAGRLDTGEALVSGGP